MTYFNPNKYIHNLYDITVPPMSPMEHEKLILWQRELRQTIVSLLGGLPVEKHPLEPRFDDPVDMGWYFRRRIVFSSRPRMDVLAYFLTPKDAQSPRPVMICLHGHGGSCFEFLKEKL